MRLQRALGLVRPGDSRIGRRVLLVALVAWAPMGLLSIVDSFLLGGDRIAAFLRDYGVHARMLITAPLLVLAEGVCIARLGSIGRHFIDSGIVAEGEQARYDAIVHSTRTLRDSVVVELGAVVLAYAIVVALIAFVPPAALPPWHKAIGGGFPGFSLAGWWHTLVSLPMLLILFIGWLWRLFLWTRFLWLVSRLDLRLIPVHPDGVAGLAFVGHSVRAFSILGIALGSVVAGRVAEQVVHHGRSPIEFAWLVAGLLLAVAILFSGPLLVFCPRLLLSWRRGVFEYGALAGTMGRTFEGKWLSHSARADKDALDVPDFSATTDLYQVVANAYRVRLVPFDLTSLVLLIAATMIPFAPVALMIMPLRSILDGIGKLLM